MTDATSASRYQAFPGIAAWGASFDGELVESYLGQLAQARARTSEQALAQAVRVATRYAAVDTGAIEGLYTVDRGFTRTIATEAAAWEATLDARGQAVARSIQDALDAYDQVLDAVTHARPITEVWIRELHSVITRSQETYVVYTPGGPQVQELPKGVYKSMPNSPNNPSTGTVHHYAPPVDTPAEMHRLVTELGSPEFRAAHPVVQAAYAHYAFVCIHPFADGNGRLARALAAVYLYRSPGVPLVVFADQRDIYLDALEAADRGDPGALVSFVEQRAVDAVELVLGHLPTGVPSAAESLARLSDARPGRGGLTSEQVDVLAARLLKMATETFSTTSRRVLDATQVTHRFAEGSRSAGPSPVAGYRRIVASGIATLESQPPRRATVHKTVSVLVAEPETVVADLVLTAGKGLTAWVFLRDLHPQETEVLRSKLDAWARHLLDELAAELVAGLE